MTVARPNFFSGLGLITPVLKGQKEETEANQQPAGDVSSILLPNKEPLYNYQKFKKGGRSPAFLKEFRDDPIDEMEAITWPWTV